jgi:hypothetical protein
MKILPDYSKYVNEKYVNGYGYGYGYGNGDGYGYRNGDGDGNGRRSYHMCGDGDIAFEAIHKKYLHNLIIIMN